MIKNLPAHRVLINCIIFFLSNLIFKRYSKVCVVSSREIVIRNRNSAVIEGSYRSTLIHFYQILSVDKRVFIKSYLHFLYLLKIALYLLWYTEHFDISWNHGLFQVNIEWDWNEKKIRRFYVSRMGTFSYWFFLLKPQNEM